MPRQLPNGEPRCYSDGSCNGLARCSQGCCIIKRSSYHFALAIHVPPIRIARAAIPVRTDVVPASATSRASPATRSASCPVALRMGRPLARSTTTAAKAVAYRGHRVDGAPRTTPRPRH
jgi:hypothetical protein